MSNRVQGLRLKSALYGHAVKLSANLGLKLGAGGMECQFHGQGAFAVWVNDDASGDYVKAVIRYPEIPDNATLNRGEADLFTGYTLHEVGHVAFTWNGMRPVWLAYPEVERKLLKKLWNGIEDGRMECCVIRDGRSKGSRSTLRRLAANLTSSMPASWSPTAITHAPFALAMLSRSALGVGTGYSNTLLNRIPEPKRSLYAEVYERCAKLPLTPKEGTRASWDLAEWFLDEWKKRFGLTTLDRTIVAGDMPKPQEEEKGDPTPEKYEESESDDLLFNDKVEGAKVDEEEPPVPGSRSEEDADPDGGDGPVGEPLDDSEDDDVEEDEGLSVSDDDESVEKPEGKEMSSGGDDDESEKGYSPTGSPTDNPFEEKAGDNEVKGNGDEITNPEPDLSEVAKRISERTRTGITLPHSAPSNVSDMSKWRNAVTDPKSLKNSESRMHKKILGSGSSKLKAIVTRLLTAPERWGWDGGAFAGRFDIKKGVEAMNGSEAVFKRRWETEGLNTALSIVIDMSSSMTGTSLTLAVDAAYAIAEAAESARCSVEVQGFSNVIATGGGFHGGNDLYGTGAYANSRMGLTSLIVAKPFHKKLAACVGNFVNLKRCKLGGTPDYETVKTAAQRLAYRPEHRKIVLVLTDGMGEVNSMGMLTENSQQLMGVEIIGIGIGMEERDYGQRFREAYKTGAAFVPTINDLGGKSMQMLEKSLRRSSKGRRVM